MNITVYSQPNCGKCVATMRMMDLKGIPYHEVNIRDKEESVDILKQMGYNETPVVVVRNSDGSVAEDWGGFHPERIKNYVI